MTNTELTTRIEAALAAARAAAAPQSVWTAERTILENLAEMTPEVAATAFVNPSSHEGYGEACAFPESELEAVQQALGTEENPFMNAAEWLNMLEQAAQ